MANLNRASNDDASANATIVTSRAARTPFDLQPQNTTRIRQGLVTHASLGEVFYRFPTIPFASSLISAVFPKWTGSSTSPNGLRPNWVVAINAYSPVAHRNPLINVTPPRSISANPVGKVTQRPRNYAPGYVTAWPMSAPQWPSFSEAPGARNG